MKRKFFTIFVLSIIISAAAFSQDIKKSNVFITVDGKEYYVHTVQKKETLWKIAKAYEVSTDDIISVNPDADKKIKPGQKLKIPTKKPAKAQASETTDYTILKGDNISSIAKKFSVTSESIFKANPGLTEKIKPDQLIKIPVKPAANKTSTVNDSITNKGGSDKSDCSNPKLLDSYNIALMIPFYLNDISQIKPDDPDIKEKEPSDFQSLSFVQYYEGILMAIDSLKKQGFSAKVYVYSVDEDTNATHRILEKPELSKMNLIIGPFFENSLKIVAKFGKKNNIKVVDPVSTSEDILSGNPNVFKASPSIQMQLKQLAKYIAGRYSTSPIVIVHNNKENEKEFLNIFETALGSELKKVGKRDSSYFKVIYEHSGISGITKHFNSKDTNIIVTLTSGEVFVTNYVNKLNDISDQYNMIVFGLPSWKSFDNIETEYMQDINLHLFSSCFVDYMDTCVQSFVEQFRDKYKTEPDRYAFQGFDVSMFFFKALKKYGVNFENCLNNMNDSYLQSNYKFVKAGKKDGFDNSYLNIYRYEDYRLVDVREHPKFKEKEKKKEVDKNKKKK